MGKKSNKTQSLQDKKYQELYSIKNLELAWNRINASTDDISYKNFYRGIFWYYESDLEKNLNILSKKLKEKSFTPSETMKIFKPKQNGLQRPFTLLEIEDLIVYQAIANIIIPSFSEKRLFFENNYVFSNLINNQVKTNIFILKNWREGYKRFKQKISKNYSNNLIFTAHFDLASYYDTIDHNSLLSEICRDTQSGIGELLNTCLLKWNNKSSSESKKIAHGIPQGPLASNIFGELFLLQIDRYLVKNGIQYSRYVDDIVIQGESLEQVQKAVILLDIKCKERGLVPQTSKFSIFKANSAEEAVGKCHSLSKEDKNYIFSSSNEVLKQFNSAIDNDNYDSSMIRYILLRYHDSDILVRQILNNFVLHYELVEDFCNYLKIYAIDNISFLLPFIYSLLIKPVPYSYVEGQLWILLANISRLKKLSGFEEIAIKHLKETSFEFVRFGIYIFLSVNNESLFISFLSHENNKMILSFLLEFISKKIIENDKFIDLIEFISKRNSSTLSSLLSKHLFYQYKFSIISEDTYKKFVQKLPAVDSVSFETINYYLRTDYKINDIIDWSVFLGINFHHANDVFYAVHIAGKRFRTVWINSINSFNDILLRALIENLKKWQPDLKCPKLITADNKINTLGNILKPESQLFKRFPELCKDMQDINERRSITPLSHAYETRTGICTKFISKKEYNDLFKKQKNIFKNLIKIIKKYM